MLGATTPSEKAWRITERETVVPVTRRCRVASDKRRVGCPANKWRQKLFEGMRYLEKSVYQRPSFQRLRARDGFYVFCHLTYGTVAQLVRAPGCQLGGCGFKPCRYRQFLSRRESKSTSSMSRIDGGLRTQRTGGPSREVIDHSTPWQRRGLTPSLTDPVKVYSEYLG